MDHIPSGGSDNLARHVQQLQLGGVHGGHRRVRRAGHGAVPANGPFTAATAAPATTSVASVACHQTGIRALMLRSFQSPESAAFSLQSPETGQPVPGFQLAFGNTLHSAAHLLAAVDEEGIISIIDTRACCNAPPPPQQQYQRQQSHSATPPSVRRRWLAHRNAVFDVIWTHDDAQVVTAAGDLFVCGWDVESQRCVFRLQGHSMSVKSVRQVPAHDHLFASGARDGNVLLWDTRAHAAPVATLQNVHAATSEPASAPFASPPNARKRKKPAVLSAPRSVTCLAFGALGHELVTAGAVDSVVKFWDVRRLTTAHHFKPTAFASRPVRAHSCSSHAGACHGISSLAFDHTRSKLLVSVLNDAIKVVDVHAAPQTPPLVQCTGHVASSFYVKAAFSPESDFILGGSADGAAFIWSASRTRAPSYVLARRPSVALKAHASEVNGVAWHQHDFTTVATCSDDGSVRVWSIARAREEAARHHQQQQRFGAASDVHACLKLQREDDDRCWRNWSDFCAQPDGFAYAVAPRSSDSGDAESMDIDESDAAAKLQSPFLVRRSAELLRRQRADAAQPTPPSRRPTPVTRRPTPSPPQTLLDFWRR